MRRLRKLRGGFRGGELSSRRGSLGLIEFGLGAGQFFLRGEDTLLRFGELRLRLGKLLRLFAFNGLRVCKADAAARRQQERGEGCNAAPRNAGGRSGSCD